MAKMTKEELQDKVVKELAKSRKMAERELAKIKTTVTSKMKEVEKFVEKNPEKAALISAGIGAALGAAMALFMNKKKR
ncbi:MAG: hypothetical protein E6R05_03665 [Candidatus Moraniibacteriota bacterium]|jgi:ElaB/YqjD/DUF883 family membrane-anchored ribosome-binding protein|nr:MAG: hypothetical protein E6R05_03665 [Candidatus Moranbacteria bacterium]